MTTENLELEKILSKQDKISEYEDLILSNTADIDPQKIKKMEEAIEEAKGLLDEQTDEIISNENILSPEEMKREDEEMNELIDNDKDELNDEVKGLADEVEGFSLENSSLFNMINITQEDMFILILLILALFFRKEIISFIKKKM